MTALEPGLYKATVRDVPDTIVFVDGAKLGRTADYIEDHREHRVRDQITDARPLIVLDINYPLDLVKALRTAAERGEAWSYLHVTKLANDIEAQTKPARIPEPGQWGLVNATTAGMVMPGTFLHDGTLWRGQRGSAGVSTKWVDLIDPTLIRDGLPS